MKEEVPRWGTHEQRDSRHEEVMRRFPGGLSWEQFVYCTLESARDETDLVEIPSVTGNIFDLHSNELRMLMDGLIMHREGPYAPIRWRITPKGREMLAQLKEKYGEKPGDAA
jgi:hypothetical protein